MLAFFNSKEIKRAFTAAFVIAFAVILLLLSFREIISNDFWWHLALGKWMLATNSFLMNDIFSYTFQGQPWLNSTWIFDLVIFKLFESTSYIGLNIFRFFVFGGTFFFLYKAARLKNTSIILILSIFLLTLPQMRPFLRPEITYPLFLSFFLWALYAYKYNRSKLIYLLPLIEVIWVNTHGSFLAGPILTGIFFGSELIRAITRSDNQVRKLLKQPLLKTYFFIFLATVLATLVSPYGYKIYLLLYAIMSDQESLRSIAEWRKQPITNFLQITFIPLSTFILLTWASFILLIRTIKNCIKQRHTIPRFIESLPLEDMVLFGVFLYFSIQYGRLNFTFSILLALLISRHITPFLTRKKAALWITAFALLSFSFVLYTQHSNLNFDSGPRAFHYPEESITFTLNNKLSGPLFNNYGDGGYLIWHLYPQHRLFIDGRTPNLYDNNFYWYYRSLNNDNIFEKISGTYQFNLALLPNGSQLANKLSDNDEWALVFFDNASQVLTRRSTSTSEFIEDHEYTTYSPNMPEAAFNAFCNNDEAREKLESELERHMTEVKYPLFSWLITANLTIECDGSTHEDYARAVNFMEQAIELQPNNNEYHYKLGVLYLEIDRYEDALSEFKKSYSIAKSKQSLTGQGIAYHNMGNYQKAEKLFKKTPFLPGETPPEYYQIYGRVSYQLDNNKKAIELLHRYLDLIDIDRITAQDYLDLSHAYEDNEEPEKATEYLERAAGLSKPSE